MNIHFLALHVAARILEVHELRLRLSEERFNLGVFILCEESFELF